MNKLNFPNGAVDVYSPLLAVTVMTRFHHWGAVMNAVSISGTKAKAPKKKPDAAPARLFPAVSPRSLGTCPPRSPRAPPAEGCSPSE